MGIFLQTDPEQRKLMAKFQEDFERKLMWGNDAHLAKKLKRKTRRKQSKKHCVVYNGKGIWEQLKDPGNVYAGTENLTLESLTSTIKDFFHGKKKKQDPIDLWKMTAKPDMPLLKLVNKNPLSGKYVVGIDPINPYKKPTRRKMKTSKPGGDGQAFKVQLMDSDTWKWELPILNNFPVIVTNTTIMP